MRALALVLTSLFLAPLSPAQQYSSDVRQRDLDFVANQLPKLHANFFFQLDPAQFQQSVNVLNAQLATATDAEFYVALAQLVALAGDAHTTLRPSQGGPFLPINLQRFDDGLVVTAASTTYAVTIGTRVVSIAGMPVDQAIAKVATIFAHGNDQWIAYLAPRYLTDVTVLQGLHISTSSGDVEVTFRTLAGQTFSLQMTPTLAAIGAGFNLPPYAYSYLAGSRLLYFQYFRCVENPSYPFAKFAADLFSTMDRNPVDTFVIDFRGNTGGDSSVINPVFNGLIARLPVLLQNPAFRVYGVIDKGTFSSGMDNAMSLKAPLPPTLVAGLPPFDSSQLIRIVGEPTGGKPSEYGEVRAFTLPGSGFSGQYSTKFFPNPPYIPDLPSFMPDVGVKTRSTDYFIGHDPVMAAILARTPAPPEDPSGSVIAVNGASFRVDTGLAPASYASLFGNFSTFADRVLVGGEDAQIFGGTLSQLNIRMPSSIPPGRTMISVRAGGSEILSGQATITSAGPGIFILNPGDISQPGAIENQDYAVNRPSNPAPQGSVVQIFATGYGPLDSSGSAAVQVFFGLTPAKVLFSGPTPQYPELWQVNAQVPAGIGQWPLYLIAGGLASNAVSVYVK